MSEVQVKREPLTYREDGAHSFFGDLIESNRGDFEARERITRHAMETRTNPTGTAGTGGEFDPPGWLIDRWAGPARAGRVLADITPTAPLPAGVSSINVPKLTTGSLTGVQPGQGTPPVSQDWVSTSNKSNVVTIAGQLDVSIQIAEQTPSNPGFDAVAYTDLVRDYNAQLEQQMINGTGTNGQLLGLSNFTVASGHSISGSSVVTTTTDGVAVLWPLLGQAFAAVGNDRKLAPEAWLLAPRRWAFIASSLDTSHRPIASPHSEHHLSDSPLGGSAQPVGSLLGVPVYLSGAVIPTAASADTAYAIRPSDTVLFEGAPKLMMVVNSLSGTLQVRFSLRRYVAFVGNRFSGGLAMITGMPQPTNF